MSGRVGPLKPSFINTYSLDFDGVDDYIGLGNDSSLDIFGSDFTISLWAKWGAQTSNSNGLINFAGNTNKAVITLGFSTQYGKISFGTGNSSTVGILYDCGSGYDDNNWHHIMCTLQGSTRTIYVDGVDISSTGLGSSIAVGSNNDIGNRARSRYFVGNIDEVSVFDSVVDIGDVWDGSGVPTDLSLLATPPVAWYRMGENGAYKSPQWLLPSNENKDKVSNYSFELDGVDDYVNCGVISNFVSSSAFSISGWFYFDSVVNETLFSYGGSVGTQYCFTVQTFAGGNLIFVIANATNDNGNNYIQTNLSSVLTTSTWYHIACTYDGSQAGNTDKAKIYVNGTEATYGSGGGTIPSTTTTSTGSFNIGRWDLGGSDNRLLNGKIDEVSIFNSVIPIGDVWDGSGLPTDVSAVSGLANYYKMGENATYVENVNPDGTWTIPDEVGTNDGTSNNLMADSARVGTAPSSSNNALSFNMDLIDRVTDVPT